MATDWRVILDDTGDAVSGGWPSVSSTEEDRCVLHVKGFVQEYWSGPNLHEAKAIAGLAADYMNGKISTNAADEIHSLRTQLAEAEARAKYWEAGYCSYVQCSLMNRVVRGEMPTAEAQALAEQTITAARSLITNTLESSDDEDGNVWKRIVPTPTTKED